MLETFSTLASWMRARLGHGLRAVLDLVYPPVLHGVPRRESERAGTVPACWTPSALHRAAVLRAARHALRAGSRRRAALARGHRRPARLRARPRRGALRRRAGPPPRAPAEIRRPAGARPPAWALDGARRRRTSRRGRSVVPVPLHRCGSWRAASTRRCCWPDRRGCGVPVDVRSCARVKATPPQVGLTRVSAPATSRAPFGAGGGGRVRGPARRARRRRADLGRDRNAAARALLRGGRAASTCSFSPGL